MKLKNLIIYLLLLCISVPVAAQSSRYAESSVLSSGDWYKIQVDQTGIYKLTYEQLVDMGVKNPANVSVFGYGGAQLPESFLEPYIDDLPQLAIHMEKGSDGVFGKGDYILFYAQGPIKWKYNKSTKCFEHEVNTYSFYGYYFVTSDFPTQKLIQTSKPLEPTTNEIITSFTDYYLYEKDEVNLLNSGRVFLGDQFNQSQLTRNYSINVPNIIANEAVIQLSVAHTAVVDASMELKLNDYLLENISLQERDKIDIIATKSIIKRNFTPKDNDKIKIQLTYSLPSSTAYLDYLVLNIQRKLQKISGDYLLFRNVKYIENSNNFTYKLSNANSNIQIWDVSEQHDVKQIPSNFNNSNLTFVVNCLPQREYVAVDVKKDNFLIPKTIGKVNNQNLHSLGQADMVIIAPSEFVNAANRLAEVHYRMDGLTVFVVTPDVIYNEFSSGTPDATAYRRFMKMFYDRAKDVGNAPKYLLLFGDGSFDNRQILKANTDKDIYRLLTYQSKESFDDINSYTTDDYFGLLDDEDGVFILTNTLDIAVGRIPVYTKEQAEGVVDKLIRYIGNENLGYWKNRTLFLADDGDDNLHVREMDSVANVFHRNNPDYLVRKLYLDSYIQEVSSIGETYPVLKKEFLDYINDGVLFVNYMGHSGYNNWTNEQILTVADIESLYNQKLPLFITASCSFSRFDDFKLSGGEALMTNSKGGALALISTSRTVLAHPNMLLNLELAKALLAINQETMRINTIGDAYKIAKNKRAKNNDSNRLSFTLLGDPAIRLAVPEEYKIQIDSVNGKDISNTFDTIGALERVLLKGSIRSLNDYSLNQSFNGFVHLSIFDKEETIETLCNDSKSDSTVVPFVYTYRTNPFYVGEVEVKDGKFEIEFIVPKDIRYNYGTGRVVMYAYDKEQNLEANGSFENMYIGGEAENIEYEYEGPTIKVYLNTPYFKNGDKVNENPLFVAELSDVSGINTIGSGIGHDIILRLDDDLKQEYVLNNYYEALFGSYSDGIIRYPLSNLPEGKHKLFFRAWDLQNNSSSTELEFEVVKDLKPKLNDLYIYPNPVVDVANIVIEHDRPLSPFDVQLYVYDLSGRLISQEDASVVTDLSNKIIIDWSIKSSMNDGLYFVKVVFIDDNGKKSSKSTKIFVRKQ
ncbi:MAG: type IX secretion system sortase PorU [Paludibacteraceae bacterium]|nr:type IX secretion system sortase PorU [Paludibacteraceae bacterium]